MNSVVTFHAVTDSRWLDRVLEYLQSQCELLPIEYLHDFYAGARVRNACHVTIDDGHRSFVDVMLPVLKRRKVHASLFVSPQVCANNTNFWFQEISSCDESQVRTLAAEMLRLPASSLTPFSVESVCKALTIGQIEEILRMAGPAVGTQVGPSQNITVKELRAVQQTGLVTIGAHTMSHPILKNEDDESCRYEIARSISDLSSLLDTEVKYFAYPNGIPGVDFAEREEACVASSGAQLAFSTESRQVARSDNRMRVPRIQIADNESPLRTGSKLRFPRWWQRLKTRRTHGEYAERARLSGVLAARS